MGITFVHDFHTKVSAVDDVSPSVDDTALRVNDGLVEVKSIKVESHGGNTHCSQPDTKNRPQGQEEVKGTRVVERGVLEDQTSKVSVGGNNVVGFFFLSEPVPSVGGLVFSSFADQRRGNQGSVHGREERRPENTCNTSHVQWVHQDVVFSLEDKHEVEGTW